MTRVHTHQAPTCAPSAPTKSHRDDKLTMHREPVERLPQVNGKLWRELDPGVLRTVASTQHPPETWHARTANPNDPTGNTSYYWLFLPIIAAILVALQQFA